MRLASLVTVMVITLTTDTNSLLFNGMFDIRYWRCVLKYGETCPTSDIRYVLYPSGGGGKRLIDVRMGRGALRRSGWDPHRRTVFILHGFNGTEDRRPLSFIRTAYLKTGEYHVIVVDWGGLTRFPCYFSAVSNTKLVAQCTAQLYAFLTGQGARPDKLLCVGHSLGAHICGMMSNHLSQKQHRIIGLDPARPLVAKFGDESFKLSSKDAKNVQVIHTNAGRLGSEAPMGHVDFCINGGRIQPSCGNFNPFRPLFRARCSHFQSACFLAMSITSMDRVLGIPCASQCPRYGERAKLKKGRLVPMGEFTPASAKGTYCVFANLVDFHCPFIF